MEDAVIAALEIGLEPRQAAGQIAEEAVVEPPHPGLALADDPRALAARPRHDLAARSSRRRCPSPGIK